MYHKILFLFFIVSTQIITSQNSKLKKANKLFMQRSYVKAAELYKQLPQSNDIKIKLGDCYYFNGLMKQASNSYLKVANTNDTLFTDQIRFKLAQSLYGSKNAKLADSIMGLLKNESLNTEKFIEILEDGVPYIYDVKKIKSGSISGDFGVGFFGDSITFSSVRAESKNLYSWNGQPYLDLYKGQITKEGDLIGVEILPKTINTKQHESNAVFSSDGKTIYFSRTNEKRYEVGDQKIATVQLYKAQLKNNEWQDVELLPFSSNIYSSQHPTIDTANKRLYFSSDMPGGYGSFDIYYVDIVEDTFGEPVNLGPVINTPYRDQFPYLSPLDSTLYFTSEGHQGLGGLDIFMSETLDKGWSTPLNLGSSLNTELDDFSFIVDANTNKGYLSSNRDGSDNIYLYKREENDRTFIVEGTVRDINSEEILPNTLVTLFDELRKPIDSVKVGIDGRYKFRTIPNSKYFLEGFKPLYIPKEVSFDTDDSGRIELNIELEIESYDDAEDIVVEKEDGYVYIELENIYFDLDKWDIKPQAENTLDVLINLMKKYPRMEVELGAHTDTRSDENYNIVLSENRAKAAYEYIISNGIKNSRLLAIGYGESQLLVNCNDNCTESEHAVNRRCEFIIIK
ncbi:OmpA family protein [Winogradskyella sp. PG-2]|uniref:OmpA family protein n=1 Tax=Winogradskyella sp. PG-2 TaxID=754409 RepID=UPI00045870E8|nr:OmpA family protein [Winogradskyella sp. PG-2]BAO76677.1 outer membrane lipoprotein omp16 precursor [Winogradskyella sp. PG-2]